MYRTVFKETWLYLSRSSKNRLTICFVLAAVLFYSFFLIPQQKSFDTIDYQTLEMEMLANKGLMEDAQENGNYRVNSFTGQSTFSESRYHYEYQRALIEAIDTGNAERYIAIIATYLPTFHTEERLDFYLKNSLYPTKDLNYDEQNFFNRVESYQQTDDPLTFSMIQEKTSWQQIQLFFVEWGPMILILLTLFIGADVFTYGIKKRTQKIGVPLQWGRFLWTQSLAILSFVTLFFIAAGLLFFVVNGLLYGFGDWEWMVPQYQYSEDYVMNMDVYNLMSIKSFSLQAIPFFAILTYLFVRFTALFSLIFRQEVVVFLAGVFTLLFERLYFSRTTRHLLGIDISQFPQTYFDFGKVITGEKNFLINIGTISVEKGLISLLVLVVIVEMILAGVTYYQTRQKYIG